MAPIGSVIKNSLIYIIIMGAAVFVAVQSFLFPGLVATIQYANGNTGVGDVALTGLFAGILIIFVALGVALNFSLPSIVGDEMIEF